MSRPAFLRTRPPDECSPAPLALRSVSCRVPRRRPSAPGHRAGSPESGRLVAVAPARAGCEVRDRGRTAGAHRVAERGGRDVPGHLHEVRGSGGLAAGDLDEEVAHPAAVGGAHAQGAHQSSVVVGEEQDGRGTLGAQAFGQGSCRARVGPGQRLPAGPAAHLRGAGARGPSSSSASACSTTPSSWRTGRVDPRTGPVPPSTPSASTSTAAWSRMRPVELLVVHPQRRAHQRVTDCQHQGRRSGDGERRGRGLVRVHAPTRGWPHAPAPRPPPGVGPTTRRPCPSWSAGRRPPRSSGSPGGRYSSSPTTPAPP